MLKPRANAILVARSERKAEAPSVIRRKTTKRDQLDLIAAENAAEALKPLPGPEESIHAVVNASFHGWSMISAILALARPATIDHLAIATLGFNGQNARDLMAKLDAGLIGSVDFVCSCYFKATGSSEFGMLAQGLRERGHRIAARRSHAKILAMRMSDGRAFVVETSANLRSCVNLEQIALIHSEPLRAFHAGWIGRLVAQGDEETK